MYRFILVIILFSYSKIGFGQLKIIKTPVTDTLDVDLTKYIPPLYLLIDSAIANNPIVRAQLYESEAVEYSLKLIKWDKFDLKAGFLDQNGIKIPVFESSVKKSVILFDQDKDLINAENQVVSVEGVNGDALKVVSDVASSCDVWTSAVDSIST